MRAPRCIRAPRRVPGLFIVVVAMLLLSGSGVIVAQPQPIRAVPIEYRAHLPLIEVFLNGKGPYEFVVDTGAGVTVLDTHLVESLGLTVLGTAAIGSPMGTAPMKADSLQIDSIGIGDASAEDLPCVALDLQPIFQPLEAPDGILSAGSFDGLLVTVDFPNNIVLVRKGELPAADGKRVLDYPSDSRVPQIPVSIGGVEISAAMDTGAPSLITLPSEYMSTLPLASEPVKTGMGHTVDANFEIHSAKVDGALVVGPTTIAHPTVTFNDLASLANVGMELLRRFSVTIDAANHRVALDESPPGPAGNSPVRRVVRAEGRHGYGIRLHGLSGELRVAGVEEGLPAAGAGLMAGDLIVAMNGKAVEALSTTERMHMLRGSPLALTVKRDTKTIDIKMALDGE